MLFWIPEQLVLNTIMWNIWFYLIKVCYLQLGKFQKYLKHERNIIKCSLPEELSIMFSNSKFKSLKNTTAKRASVWERFDYMASYLFDSFKFWTAQNSIILTSTLYSWKNLLLGIFKIIKSLSNTVFSQLSEYDMKIKNKLSPKVKFELYYQHYPN